MPRKSKASSAGGDAPENTRIAIVSSDKCKPKKCKQECKKSCPVVRRGKLCIEVKSTSKLAFISEELCIGCGICVKKCPFGAINIINLPKSLNDQTTHRYGPNSFKLHRLPMPRPNEVLGLVGTNGIGKSTALKILAGKLKPNLGQFDAPPDWEDILKHFRGSELQNYFTKILMDDLKAVIKPQYVDHIPKAVKGQVGKLLKSRDSRKVSKYMAQDLDLTHVLDREVIDLSGGELQRFAIAVVAVQKADVYMFDEPSSYLDVRQRMKAAQTIRALVDLQAAAARRMLQDSREEAKVAKAAKDTAAAAAAASSGGAGGGAGASAGASSAAAAAPATAAAGASAAAAAGGKKGKKGKKGAKGAKGAKAGDAKVVPAPGGGGGDAAVAPAGAGGAGGGAGAAVDTDSDDDDASGAGSGSDDSDASSDDSDDSDSDASGDEDAVAAVKSHSRQSYVVVVEHDLAVLDYLSDYICCLYGKPGGYGVVTMPFSVRDGINVFLAGFVPTENMRFRDEELTFKVAENVEEERGDATKHASYTYPALKKTLRSKSKGSKFKLKVEAGSFNNSQIIVMLGENGTGKTTFIRMLAGRLKPDPPKGSKEPPKIDGFSISYKPQKISPSASISVRALLYKKIRDAYAHPQFQTDVVRPMLIEEIIDQDVKNLSGGELQRLAITVALGTPSDVYLIDEPSAYLDSEQRIVAAKVIKRFILHAKKTAFIVEHDFIMATYLADRVIVYSGKPGITATAHTPQSLLSGMNQFLRQIGITFRRDPTNFRPRINKMNSVKDQEQKRAGTFFYLDD